MTTPELRFSINLLEDLTVVTRDGEYLGTWDTDESDAFYEFTPDGHEQYLLMDPYMGRLCEQIEEWLRTR
jgi:hypothetical protein